jgi:hypothetical protein
MFRKLVSISALALLLSLESGFAKGPYGRIHVGAWKGGAYANDQTGEFTSCIAGASYKSGIYFNVMVTSNLAWALGFSHDNWTLSRGQEIQIVLTFDGRAPFNVKGTALSRSLVSVPMPDHSDLINQFRRSQTMSAFAQGNVFQFDLKDTSSLLPSLVNCVAQIKKNGLHAAGDFTINASRSAQPSSTAAVGGSLRTEAASPSSAEFQIEAIELATNFILKSALSKPQVLSRAETPVSLASYGAAWRSEEASGFVRIIPPQPNQKGLDVAAAVVANDAKDCKAKFASGRTSELIDSEVVFRGFSSCEDSDGARLSHYFIVSRKKGGFVLFSVVSNNKSEPARNIAREEKLTDFKKAALTAVSN